MSRRLAIAVCGVSATNALPPSRAARESRTISVPRGSLPDRTSSAKPPHLISSSAQRSEFTLFDGLTSTGPSRQNSPAMVPIASIHAARSPVATVASHAARSTAVAPPFGIHTDSRPRGRPPPGRIASS
ncbi:MAG TPA: hypothetical protein VIF83_07140 [Gemmatimonadaceae bacterium]